MQSLRGIVFFQKNKQNKTFQKKFFQKFRPANLLKEKSFLEYPFLQSTRGRLLLFLTSQGL